MARVIANMSMSLDGYIADRSDGTGELFGWYSNGEVTVPSAAPQWTFQVSPASAGVLRGALADLGALVCGRRLVDITGGWGGSHHMGVPAFVVTHSIPDRWPRPDTPTSLRPRPPAFETHEKEPSCSPCPSKPAAPPRTDQVQQAALVARESPFVRRWALFVHTSFPLPAAGGIVSYRIVSNRDRREIAVEAQALCGSVGSPRSLK